MLSDLDSRETQPGANWLPEAAALGYAMQQILSSTPFRTSRQCQELLRYIVERSIEGDDASLRERIIGVTVFRRQPSYDTSQDPVVRNRAADVRKRLAQYYQTQEASGARLRIELQPGSYRAHFRQENHELAAAYSDQLLPQTSSFSRSGQGAIRVPGPDWMTPETAKPDAAALEPVIAGSQEHRSRTIFNRMKLLLLLSPILLVIAWAGFGIFRSMWPTPQRRFWAPFREARQPVLLYLGSNAAYIFSEEYLAHYRTAHNMPNTGPEFFVDLPSSDSVRSSDLLPVRNTFVTTGDLAAAVQLTTMLTNWKQAFVLRSGNDLAFGDLRNRPSVMIGGFNNPWTLELTSDLPYRLSQGTRIEQRDHPERGWLWSVPSNKSNDDYALIARIRHSKTGGPLIIVAGIGENGTQGAAEFLADPDRMRDLLRSAPRGWENKDMEIVLHIKIVSAAPVEIEPVARAFW